MQTEMVELSRYRMEKATEWLADAQDAFEENRLANSINRSYYAVFHATRAMLALEVFDSKKHSSIIGYFNQYYVATGKLIKITFWYWQRHSEFAIRRITMTSIIVSKIEAQKQLENGRAFVDFIGGYIDDEIRHQGMTEI